MKQQLLIISIFSDDWSLFKSEIYGIIENNLEFSCDIDNTIDITNISFLKSAIKIQWEIEDGESNTGYISVIFDNKGLAKINMYFLYEDDNEYKETLFKR